MLGFNQYGCLGLGDRNSRADPTRLSGFTNVIQVLCGYYTTSFVTSQGRLYVCGLPSPNRSGPGWIIPTIPPSLLNCRNIIQVSCFDKLTIAFVTDLGQCYRGEIDDNDRGYFRKLEIPECMSFKFLVEKNI